MIFELCKTNSIASQFLSEIRSEQTQTHRMQFRKNIERISMILAYEVSKNLPYRAIQTTTPLSQATSKELEKAPVIISVLRAGLSMHQGFIEIFDRADFGFIGAYRKEESKEGEIEIALEYAAHPDVSGRDLILLDPMLATGKSLIEALDLILEQGKPRHIHIVSVVSSAPGISYLQEKLSKLTFDLYTAVIDPELNEHAYIVPGLGDAGDLAFGPKL
jgi:uracil phosphoribosyltransferase